MDRWRELELFVHIAELGSLTRAAEAAGLSVAAASRHLATLEQRLSARLVERNTRRLYLTEVGQEFYRRSKNILGEMQEAELAVNATVLDPSGDLRITSSLSFAMRHIAPLLPEYNQRYPKVNVHLLTANRYYDLIDNGIDLAIRTREHESDTANLTVRRLAETRRILAASPRYLDQHGTPRTVDDLAHHKLLLYTYSNRYDELRFSRGDEVRVLQVKGVLEANDGQVLCAAAREGLGILVQPKYIIYDDIVAGRLVPVLNDWDLPRLTINIAYPHRRYLPAKTRSFIDFLAEHFRARDFERKWRS
ncbi:HTH-type transcriptional regulator DmlR [Pigmentiphaga humi]|uniref:HTH-type transcriptional regulator DmlR n=1 Tax=Pigmentiphaga humi TaxID=2478468 RepID=A0A3P4B5W3_9BURK|nr:LysR family transcriptional regulator [Pigmentiphaga humi]VCU71301.1 HTH-type transcriptional regulator DmlR [Pigmentiphaga humi]